MVETSNEKDYRVRLSVRNNKLLKMMEMNGITSAAELARETGISYQSLSKILNLKISAYTSGMQVRKPLQKICDFFNVIPETIYPEDNLFDGLENNYKDFEVSMSELQSISNSPQLSAIEYKDYQDDGLCEILDSAIGEALNDRERRALEIYFGIDGSNGGTFQDVAENFGVSVNRASQIFFKAMRKLRQSDYSDELIDALEGLE